MTPTTTGFQFSFPFCPKYYNSDSLAQGNSTSNGRLELKFSAGAYKQTNKQYDWLGSERKRVILILFSCSKDWRKPKYKYVLAITVVGDYRINNKMWDTEVF